MADKKRTIKRKVVFSGLSGKQAPSVSRFFERLPGYKKDLPVNYFAGKDEFNVIENEFGRVSVSVGAESVAIDDGIGEIFGSLRFEDRIESIIGKHGNYYEKSVTKLETYETARGRTGVLEEDSVRYNCRSGIEE